MKYGGGIVPPRQMSIIDCICGCQTRFSLQEMRTIFRNFNDMENHELQNSYLRGLLEVSRRENFANGGGRKIFQYKLKLVERTVIVCQRFFLGIHGIPQSRLRKKVVTK